MKIENFQQLLSQERSLFREVVSEKERMLQARPKTLRGHHIVMRRFWLKLDGWHQCLRHLYLEVAYFPKSKTSSTSGKQLKTILQNRGWSYRSAAPVLGVTYQYLCLVCNNKAKSRRLSKKILAMPTRAEADQAAQAAEGATPISETQNTQTP